MRSFVERLFPGTVQRAAERIAAGIVVTEAPEPEWAFQKIGSGKEDIPEGFVAHVIQQSKRLYESHGLGWRLIERLVTIMVEGGYTFAVKFADGVPPEYQARISKALDEFWYDEDVDIQDRAREMVLQCLLAGEHGWEVRVSDTGRVAIGDFSREDVESVAVDAFDSRRLLRVDRNDDRMRARPLAAIRKTRDKDAPGYGHLAGECLYMRLGARSQKHRGTPILQRVVDELNAEKKFRVLSCDRALDRMSVVMRTRLQGFDLKSLEDYKRKNGTALPGSRRIYENESITNEFMSANMEAGEIAALIRTNITVIAGAFGFPLSWFGFGDGSTKATSETQQGPAEMDANQMKQQFIQMLEKLLYFVVDQAILKNRIDATATPNASLFVEVKDGDSTRMARLRDCVTITASTVPLVKSEPSSAPLAATATAVDITGKLAAMSADSEKGELMTRADILSLMNFALASDGVGIELIEDSEGA